MSAASLLRDVGLLPDGPVLWGRPVPARGPGLYLVELPEPMPSPPIELTRVGKWIERLPGLRLDGERPTSKAVANRMAALWLPGETVLYAGATDGRIGGRVAALVAHVLGDRTPHADGQWLHALGGVERSRIWWAETDAAEEYLDAILDAFAEAVATTTLPDTRPAEALALPWAVTRRPTGERQVHGLTGSIAPAESGPVRPAPGTIVTQLPPGDAEGARVEEKGTGTRRRAPATTPRRTKTSSERERAARSTAPASSGPPKMAGVHVTASTLERMKADLHELTAFRRPEVVARVAAARELGDLRENAEYHAAREEHSFLEGRIRTLEHRIRYAVVIDAPDRGGTGSPTATEGSDGRSAPKGRARLGSRVTVDQEGETIVYVIVGSADADPAAGRVSDSSPVGAALLGASPGDEVTVKAPRGAMGLRVVSVD